MKVQGFKRIIVEDFEEKDRNLVGKIAFAVNVFAEEIVNALNKNISIQDNINITQKDITVTVNNLGVPTSATTVTSQLLSICQGIQVIRADNLTNPSITPTSQPFISFSDNGQIIKVNKITGLQANNTYRLKVILYP